MAFSRLRRAREPASRMRDRPLEASAQVYLQTPAEDRSGHGDLAPKRALHEGLGSSPTLVRTLERESARLQRITRCCAEVAQKYRSLDG